MALILTLLLATLLLVGGMAYLCQRQSEARWSQNALNAMQARTLAEAGLEDARLKLGKLHSFPPFADEQKQFEYSEDIVDFNGRVAGTYTVKIDSRLTAESGPYRVLKVESLGRLGPRSRPLAQRLIYAELDLSPVIRGTNTPNPKFFHWIDFQDRGGL